MNKKFVNYRIENNLSNTIDKFSKEFKCSKTKIAEIALIEFFKRRNYEIESAEVEVII